MWPGVLGAPTPGVQDLQGKPGPSRLGCFPSATRHLAQGVTVGQTGAFPPSRPGPLCLSNTGIVLTVPLSPRRSPGALPKDELAGPCWPPGRMDPESTRQEGVQLGALTSPAEVRSGPAGVRAHRGWESPHQTPGPGSVSPRAAPSTARGSLCEHTELAPAGTDSTVWGQPSWP